MLSRMSRPVPPPTPYAAEVRSARVAAGLSQVALSITIGVAPSTIYRAEQGFDLRASVKQRLDKWMAAAARRARRAA